jgi:hypothetical protein
VALLSNALSPAVGRVNSLLGRNTSPPSSNRIPIVWDSEFRRTESVKFPHPLLIPLEMSVNPNTMSWSQSKRYSEKKVRKGSVFYHFTDKSGASNDIIRINFKGSTGNIDLRTERLEDGSFKTNGAKDKLTSFYSLYLMSREPVRLIDNTTKNQIYLSIQSPMFPNVIVSLSGFFDSVINFEETAGKPNSRDYDFTYIVEKTDRSMEDLVRSSVTPVVPQQTSRRSLDG